MLLCCMTKEMRKRRRIEIMAGIFLILTGIVLFISFITRVEYITYFTSFSDDFEYLNDNIFILHLNSLFWIISAFFMIFSSASLLVSMKIHNEFNAYITSFFFFLSAALFCFIGMKGIGVLELLVFQETRFLDLVENEYIKANVISLTKEKDIFIRLVYAMVGTGFLFIGFFGFSTKMISFILRFLCFLGGINLILVSVFFFNSILIETGLLFVLFIMFLLGVRLVLKGFTRKIKKKS